MNPGKKLPLILWSLIFCFPVSAQTGRLIFHHFNIRDGLKDTYNAFTYKDSKGLVWISSVSGLHCFDGTKIRLYYPDPQDPSTFYKDNIQSSFFEDEASNLWFTTFEGLFRYDRSRDCFDSFEVPSTEKPKVRYFLFYKERNEKLWLLCEDDIYTFTMSTGEFEFKAKVNKDIHRLVALPDQHGNVSQIWAYRLKSSLIEKLSFYQDTFLRHETYTDHMQPEWHVQKLIAQGDSLVWMLFSEMMIKYDSRTDQAIEYELDQKEAVSFEIMNDSTFLLAINNNGLWEWNIRRQAFGRHYQHRESDPLTLSSDQVWYINRDRNGGIWTSAPGAGVNYSVPEKCKFELNVFSQSESSSQYSAASNFLAHTSDSVLCTTEGNGAYWIINGEAQRKVVPIAGLQADDLDGSINFAVRDTEQHYWIGTTNGMFMFNPATEAVIEIPNKDFMVTGILCTNGRLLFTTTSIGVVTPVKTPGENYELSHVAFDTSGRYSMIKTDKLGRLWLMEDQSRINILDSTGNHILSTLPIAGFIKKLEHSIHDSLIWVASPLGLFKIDAQSLEIKNVYNKNQYGAPVIVSTFEIDRSGQIWVSTSESIGKLDQETERIRMYNENDGVQGYQFTGASYQSATGEIWFGSIEGITYFNPEKIRDLEIQAQPMITEIQINDKPINKDIRCAITGATNEKEINKLILDYNHNTLTFRVNALEYSAPAQNRVGYQLIGLDKHEVQTTNGTMVRYPNLPSGHYQFMMYAYNSDGIRNPVPRIFSFFVTPPFYKTWWFVSLMFLTGGSILAYIVYLRFSKKLELQNVRLKLYENLHDDVGSRLTAIVLSAEDLERNDHLNNPKIKSIAQIAKSIVSNMRRLVWAIDPENDRMLNVVQKITHDKSVLMGDRVALHIEMESRLNNVVVPGEIRYQISAICSEALSNISKYAEASNVTIKVFQEQRKFHITITDDGLGFDPESTSKNALTGSGYGLNNMKRRAARVKGKLDVYASPGKGTRIEASFPY